MYLPTFTIREILGHPVLQELGDPGFGAKGVKKDKRGCLSCLL